MSDKLIDYKALIRDRSGQERRKPVRHVICLDPDLLSEMEEAEQELRQALREASDDETPGVDKRAGAVSPVTAAEERVQALEERIKAASIVGVFRPLAPEAIAKEIDKAQKRAEDQPDQINELAFQSARETTLDTFEHFEGPDGKRIPDLGKEDLEEILKGWHYGEIVGLGNKINAASLRSYDIPKSVASSLLNPRSGETSN